MSLVNNAWNFFLETYGPYFSSMLVSASDWLKLIFEKVWGFAYIKITLSTNLDMHNRFQGSFCCDLPLQDLNLVSASGGMVTGWNSHQPEIFVFKSSTQQQSCKAHEIGQFCHQDHPSIWIPLNLINQYQGASYPQKYLEPFNIDMRGTTCSPPGSWIGSNMLRHMGLGDKICKLDCDCVAFAWFITWSLYQ